MFSTPSFESQDNALDMSSNQLACYSCQEHNTRCQRKPGMLICPTCSTFGFKCKWPKHTETANVPQLQKQNPPHSHQRFSSSASQSVSANADILSTPTGIHEDFYLHWPYAPTRPLVVPDEYLIPIRAAETLPHDRWSAQQFIDPTFPGAKQDLMVVGNARSEPREVWQRVIWKRSHDTKKLRLATIQIPKPAMRRQLWLLGRAKGLRLRGQSVAWKAWDSNTVNVERFWRQGRAYPQSWVFVRHACFNLWSVQRSTTTSFISNAL